jgi:3-hydroxyanthranilate 3,4-dioxygenase
VEVHVGNIVDDLPPLFEAFYSSQELRTCDSCGATQPGRHDTA